MNEKEYREQYCCQFIDPISGLKDHPLFKMFVEYYNDMERIDRSCPGYWKGEVYIPFPSKKLTELRKSAPKYPSKSAAKIEYGIDDDEFYRIRDIALSATEKPKDSLREKD